MFIPIFINNWLAEIAIFEFSVIKKNISKSLSKPEAYIQSTINQQKLLTNISNKNIFYCSINIDISFSRNLSSDLSNTKY